MQMNNQIYGIIGGTGPEGQGIALRLSKMGLQVAIGSRDDCKAKSVAQKIAEIIPEAKLEYGSNSLICKNSDILILATPYSAQKSVLEANVNQLTNKILINVVAPIEFKKGRFSAISVLEGSAACQAQILLPKTKVVSAFQTISAKHLLEVNLDIRSDVIVCSNFEDAKIFAMDIISRIPVLNPIDGGELENSGYVENFTALLLNINQRYKVLSSIKILGL